jgi:hypothetical protein
MQPPVFLYKRGGRLSTVFESFLREGGAAATGDKEEWSHVRFAALAAKRAGFSAPGM